MPNFEWATHGSHRTDAQPRTRGNPISRSLVRAEGQDHPAKQDGSLDLGEGQRVNEQPTHLDLFSGIGGFALSAKWAGFKTVGFCEIDPYCQAVLRKHWPQVPIHTDIKELRGGAYRGCSLLTGGFPCQPFSHAGKQRGKDDDRYLWPEMLRVIREARPAWIIGENVAGIVNMALDQVCADLEAEGYEVEPLIIPACGVDAPHKRDRVWIVANAEGGQRGGLQDAGGSQGTQGCVELSGVTGGLFGELRAQDVANAEGFRIQGHRAGGIKESPSHGCERLPVCKSERSQQAKWLLEPGMDRVVNGLPNRVDRIKCLGNAIVPQVAFPILEGIRKLIEENGEN